MTPAGIWIKAFRLRTLPLSLSATVLGSFLGFAGDSFKWGVFIFGSLTTLFLQILSNLANDYFDFKKGADTSERLGPPRVMQQGLVSETAMKKALFLVILMAAGTGGTLVWHGGWPYALMGVLALLSAIAYTGGPYPLGYNGLGDIFVFLFFGIVAVVGTTHLCCGDFPTAVWPAACAMGVLAVNLLVVNNVRDYRQDRQHGKKTLVARWGKRFGILQYALGLLLAYLCVGIIAAMAQTPLVFLTGALAPMGINTFRRLVALEGKSLNSVLAQTASFTFLFGFLLSLSLVFPLEYI